MSTSTVTLTVDSGDDNHERVPKCAGVGRVHIGTYAQLNDNILETLACLLAISYEQQTEVEDSNFRSAQ